MPTFKGYKKSSPTINGISNRGMECDSLSFDSLAEKHGVPLKAIYEMEISHGDEWHHVRKIVKGERTGNVIKVIFDSEENFIEYLLDGYMDRWVGLKFIPAKFNLTPEIRSELLARSVDSYYN
jgi:hypothetical protein